MKTIYWTISHAFALSIALGLLLASNVWAEGPSSQSSGKAPETKAQGSSAENANREIEKEKKRRKAERHKAAGKKANALENRIMKSPSKAKLRGRFVIPGIRPHANKQYGRGAQKATIKRFKSGNIAIIGQYWDEDGSLVMSGGRIFSTRRGGHVTVGLYGLHYVKGQARVLEKSEKLSDVLPSTTGTVHRFVGEIPYRGYTFKGEEGSPLSFGLVKKVGYVYLRGKGVVTLKNGKQVRLGR